MKWWGNRRRLCCSAWLIAALLLMAVNGYHLLSMENQQLAGHSPTIKALRANMAHWENAKIAQSWVPDGNNLDLLRVRHRPSPPEPAKEASTSNDDVPAIDASAPVALPVLAGMVKAMDPRGRLIYWAVLDGRVCRASEKIGTFVIDEISSRGVVLNRNGQKWHLDCPTPDHTTFNGN